MKHIVMLEEGEYKEVVSALRRLRMAVNALSTSYLSGELDLYLERIEKVFFEEEQS